MVDAFVWAHPDMTILFAAGNKGSNAGTIGTPATAKDVVSVGGAYNPDTGGGLDQNDLAPQASRGPTTDGRIKPTIVTIFDGDSAMSDGDPLSLAHVSDRHWGGTSYSTPAAAAAAAIIRQYFVDGWYPSGAPIGNDSMNPSAALIRAILIASGQQVTGSGTVARSATDTWPNNEQGFGRVLLSKVLPIAAAGDPFRTQVVDGTAGLLTGDAATYTFRVSASGPAKFVLTWSDYPGAIGATKALVNDLDLEVTAPNGTVYRGNHFAPFAQGQSLPGGNFDTTNVEEAVIVRTAAVGDWTVRVIGFNIPVGPQPFALVATGNLDASYGRLSLDRVAYSEADTIRISVEDSDATSVIAHVASGIEAGGENVTLARGGPDETWHGSIATAFGTPAPDNVLQVREGDTVTVTYQDLSPSHAAVAQAKILASGPTIHDVTVTGIGSTTATVRWTPAAPRAGTGGPGPFGRAADLGPPPPAAPQPRRGVIGRVGLEQSPPFNASARSLVQNYLGRGGRLIVSSHDTAWALGSVSGSTPSPFATAETAAWVRGVLKATFACDPTTIVQVRGLTSDPISGAYTGGVAYTPHRDGGADDELTTNPAGGSSSVMWTDGSPVTGCTPSNQPIGLRWVSASANGTAGNGTWGGTPSRLAYFAFEITGIDSTLTNLNPASPTRAAILDAALRWLLSTSPTTLDRDHPDVNITSPNGGTFGGPSITVTWSATVYGTGIGLSNFTLESSADGGLTWTPIATLPGSARSYKWGLGTAPNGNRYLLRILVRDDGTPSLSSSDITDARFTIARPGGDTAGPLLWAGSGRIAPRPPGVAPPSAIPLLVRLANANQDLDLVWKRVWDEGLYGGTTEYRVLRATSPRGPYADVSGAILGNGSATYEFVDPARGADVSDYFYRIETVDAATNAANSTSLLVKVHLAFAVGLNLLGMPVDLTDPTFGDLVAGRAWADAWTYDACSGGFGWSSAIPSDASTFALPKGRGFWLNGTAADAMTLVGLLPGVSQIRLCAGWNLIALPGFASGVTVQSVKVSTGASLVMGFDPAGPYHVRSLSDADMLAPGAGYWIEVPVGVTWTLAGW